MNKVIPVIIYCVINFLFIWKYGSRLDAIYLPLMAIGFLAIITLLIKSNNLNKLYWPIAIFGSLLVLIINLYVDCESLNVDRCSALSVSIQELIKGNYPYTATDHLGGRSSHLPGLFIMAAPFYWIGDVGIFQLGVLLLFVIAIYKKCNNVFLIIALLFISPAYWWEVYSKSDLLSNFLIILSLYLLFKDSLINLIHQRTYVFGLVISILVFTRITAIIPLCILATPYILKLKKGEIIKLIIGGIIGLIAMVLMIHPWQMEADVLINQNPFELQNRFVPFWLALGVMGMSLFVGWTSSISDGPYRSIAIVLLVPILFSLGVNVYEGSFYNAILNSSFDISYFNMVLPFLILWIVEVNKKNTVYSNA